MKSKNLCPEAQRLVELCYGHAYSKTAELTLTQAIQQHPELITGLAEYQDFVAESERMAGQTDQKPSVGHSVAAAVKKAADKK